MITQKALAERPPSPAWNPRYLAYAKAHGNPDPTQMLAADRKAWPGGHMAGFTLWITERWATWRILRGVPRDGVLTAEDHADFDAWLRAIGGAS